MEEIYWYSMAHWGVVRAERYIAEMYEAFNRIRLMPGIGRSATRLYPGLRKADYARHVIFYLEEPDGILIARILHDEMMPSRPQFLGV